MVDIGFKECAVPTATFLDLVFDRLVEGGGSNGGEVEERMGCIAKQNGETKIINVRMGMRPIYSIHVR